MKTVFEHIELHKNRLSQHPFCRWLKEVPRHQDALIFAPSMSFFVLGFRDILELAKRPNPQTSLERAINVHCLEDAEHWRWFIKDIETLGYLDISPQELIHKIWSDDERIPRNMVYFLTHLIQRESDPKILLVIIECLEAAFAVFIDALRPQLLSRDIYDRLIYFGQRHDLGEQAHAMGSWIDGADKSIDFGEIEISSSETKAALEIVDQIFLRFSYMFEHWRTVADSGDYPARMKRSGRGDQPTLSS